VKALGAQPNSPPAPGELCFITSDEGLEARAVGQLLKAARNSLTQNGGASCFSFRASRAGASRAGAAAPTAGLPLGCSKRLASSAV